MLIDNKDCGKVPDDPFFSRELLPHTSCFCQSSANLLNPERAWRPLMFPGYSVLVPTLDRMDVVEAGCQEEKGSRWEVPDGFSSSWAGYRTKIETSCREPVMLLSNAHFTCPCAASAPEGGPGWGWECEGSCLKVCGKGKVSYAWCVS